MRSNQNNKSIHTAVVETLEGRQMLSASGLSVYQTSVNGVAQLQITGTSASDKITLKQTSAGLVIGNGKFSQTLTATFGSIVVRTGNGNDSVVEDASVSTPTTLIGGVGNDTLTAGSGNDTIYVTSGKNVIHAGNGNDTIVTLGATADSVYGGAGQDTFWVNGVSSDKVYNVTDTEVSNGTVHRVDSFYGSTPASTSARKTAAKKWTKTAKLNITALADPSVTTSGLTYTNFSSHPLFASNGPTQDDIRQGDLGDCYFLSTLAATAKIDPMKIEQSVVQLADGSYVVQFSQNGGNIFVHTDGSLPTWGNGSPAYANFGQQGSMWVAVMEKAFAAVRTGANSYSSLNSGWMTDAFSALGFSSTGFYTASSPTDLFQTLSTQLNEGKAVTFGTTNINDNAPLIGGHAYEVVSADAATKTVVLRNPWGVDGAGNDSNPNDGYVTVTAKELYDNFLGAVSAKV